jgi:hypothetical protein
MPPLTETEYQLLLQVRAYMHYTNLFCSTLHEVFNLDFTRVSRTERYAVMSNRGKVKGITYAFHGIGCHFQTKQIELDIDFDSSGNWAGVDLWRLQHFLEDNKLEPRLTPDELAQHVEALVQKKQFYQMNWEDGRQFYYLATS